MNPLFSRIREKALDVSARPVLTVALGDSVTQGEMELGRISHGHVYHRLLQTQLEALYPTTTFSTINAGVSGSSALQATERLQRDVLSHAPDLVLVAFGLNDSLGGIEKLAEFEAALTQIITGIREETAAEIVLLTPPFMASSKHLHRIHPEHHAFADAIIAAQTSGTLAAYAEKVRDVASRHRTLLADVHTEWERLAATRTDTNLWLANGLNHPDERGHQLAATLIFHTLLQQR